MSTVQVPSITNLDDSITTITSQPVIQPKPVLDSISTNGSIESTRSPSPFLEEKKNLRVLIVDDNYINLRTLSRLLNRRFGGFLDGPPVSVDSGLKAIQQLRSQVFDVIFMDIQVSLRNLSFPSRNLFPSRNCTHARSFLPPLFIFTYLRCLSCLV